MDFELAVARIDTTLDDITNYVGSVTRRDYTGGGEDPHAKTERLDLSVQEGLAVARQVAAASPGHVDPSGFRAQGMAYTADRWDIAKAGLRTLRAGLVTAAEVTAIVGPSGPSLNASTLHPIVWNAAVYLWDDGHYRAAVQAAATAVDLMASAKVGVPLHGTDLFRQAFSAEPPRPDRPRLRFTDVPESDSQRWASQHTGARDLGAGAMEFVRNDTTHHLAELDRTIALEYLALLSIVARQVERSTVVRA